MRNKRGFPKALAKALVPTVGTGWERRGCSPPIVELKNTGFVDTVIPNTVCDLLVDWNSGTCNKDL